MSNWGHAKNLPLAEIADGRIMPPPPLFSGFLLDNTLTMISAPPFVGKSLLLGAMAISLDSGRPLFGKHAPAEDKRVVMIAQDAPTWDYAGQLNKLIRGFGLTKEETSALETLLVVNQGVQVTDSDFFEQLAAIHEKTDFNVLILDAFWTIHSLNEVDNSQMGLVMGRLKRIREMYGCAVLFAHHERKPIGGDVPANANYRARGASVIPASVDFNMSLHRTGSRVRIQMAKGRGADDEGLIFYDIKDVDHSDGPAIKLEAVSMNNTRLGEVLDFIAQERKRAEVVEFIKSKYPEMTQAKAAKAADNDLRLLRANRKADQVRYGVWKAC